METFELNPQKIKEMRLAMGLSQDKLAHRSMMHGSHISHLERPELGVCPRPETLKRLAVALGIECEVIWTGKPRPGNRLNSVGAKLKPAPASRERDNVPHTYTIVIRTPGYDKLMLTTTDRREAHRKYAAMCADNRLPRVIMDGQDLPIYSRQDVPTAAGRHTPPLRKHKNKKRKSQPAG